MGDCLWVYHLATYGDSDDSGSSTIVHQFTKPESPVFDDSRNPIAIILVMSQRGLLPFIQKSSFWGEHKILSTPNIVSVQMKQHQIWGNPPQCSDEKTDLKEANVIVVMAQEKEGSLWKVIPRAFRDVSPHVQ